MGILKEGPTGAKGCVVGQICVCEDHIKPGQVISMAENGRYNHTGCHFRELTEQAKKSEGGKSDTEQREL
ncbi:MAG: hypothetical protein WCK60_02715 [Candidatus Nomurabacteria bacterium]